MKNFRLLIWGAAACGAAVLTGCVQTADNQLSPMEKDWERVIRSSYPGYRTPKTTAPAQRDGVVDYRVPAAQAAADNSMTAASTDPVPVEDPVSAVDKAAAADPSSEIKEPAMPVPAPAKEEVKAEEKAAAPAEEVKSEDKSAKAEAPAKDAKDAKAKDAKAAKGEPVVVAVKAGDTIGGLAKEFLGNAKYADVILKANPHVKDPKRLRIGTKLVIPTL
ncbi:MAG: LysM peptidoglycan-binding domain-containing protein [Lentisphaeria bacterium]|nr:LysM peptidoglycan-binding domain-containing protein [Lentisphaeria bacterium]